MKEATGELNMTVITVVAIAAVAALFYTLVWPAIQKSIVNNTCATLGSGWHAVKVSSSEDASKINADNASKLKYACCPSGVDSITNACTAAD